MPDAVKAAPDPSLAQERPLASHAGGAHFTYNATPARAKAARDAGRAQISRSTRRASSRTWTKDALTASDDGEPWQAENSKEAHSYRPEPLAKGSPN